MKTSVAELIGKKAGALKHCEKLLKLIHENGTTDIRLNNTGVTLTVQKGDYLHTMLLSEKSKLVHEINAIEITSGLKRAPRLLPAPVGASHVCPNCGKPFGKACNRQVFCTVECREEYKKREKSKKTEGTT